MLILTRKPGEVIYIGDLIKVTLVEIKGNQVRVGIDAPNDLRIYRKEIYDQIQEENRIAAAGADLAATASGLEGITPSWGDDSGEGKKKDSSAPRALGGFATAKVKPNDPQVVVRKKRERKPDE